MIQAGSAMWCRRSDLSEGTIGLKPPNKLKWVYTLIESKGLLAEEEMEAKTIIV